MEATVVYLGHSTRKGKKGVSGYGLVINKPEYVLGLVTFEVAGGAKHLAEELDYRFGSSRWVCENSSTNEGGLLCNMQVAEESLCYLHPIELEETRQDALQYLLPLLDDPPPVHMSLRFDTTVRGWRATLLDSPLIENSGLRGAVWLFPSLSAVEAVSERIVENPRRSGLNDDFYLVAGMIYGQPMMVALWSPQVDNEFITSIHTVIRVGLGEEAGGALKRKMLTQALAKLEAYRLYEQYGDSCDFRPFTKQD